MPSSISRRGTSSPATLLSLWTGVLGPPLLYLFDLELSYALANRACSSGDRVLYSLSTLAAAVLVVATGLLAWRQLHAIPADPDSQGARAVDRNRFLAIGGIAFSAGFLLLILSNFVPKFMLGVCD